MPRNSVGQYIPPTNSWSPSVNGVLATTGDWQALLNDIVAALTQSVSNDGQTPMISNLNMGNNRINNVTAANGTGQALAYQQLYDQGTQADIASAATTDIGTPLTNFLRVTGNTTITSFGTTYKGPRFLVFASALTLTHSSSLVLPGATNISVNAGDSLIVVPGATLETPDKWVVIAYQSATNPSQLVTLTGTQTLTNKTLTSPTITSPTISGGVTVPDGTANGVTYLNGSKVLTSGSALTFDGTRLATTGRFNSAGVYEDSSGNLGLGVTPSAWTNGLRAIEVGNLGSSVYSGGQADMNMTSNAYFNSGWKYGGAGGASKISLSGNTFAFSIAPSGTAGNAISFTQAMTLDVSGRLVIGTTSSSSAGIKIGNQYGGVDLAGSGGSYANWGGGYGIWPWNNIGLGIGSAAAIGFVVNGGTEAACIDTSGNLLVGTTSPTYLTDRVSIQPTASNGTGIGIAVGNFNTFGIGIYNGYTATGTATALQFQDHNSIVRGSITVTTSATAYNTSSDYRLKENIAPMTGALAKVTALKPVTYTWKADGSAGEGFIAHELAEVCPAAVTGEKDAVDAEGNPKYQGIDVSFLVGTLTAAIQELKAEFDAYKASHP